MKLLMNAQELSEAIGIPLGTIYQYASKKPEVLPPRMQMATRKLLWSVDDVEAWVRAHSGIKSKPATE